MMNANSNLLDPEELLQLAIRASTQNQHEESISYLKRAIEQDPRSAKLYYMLGAEHAEIGLYNRAIEEITQATKLDPHLDTAHFQLGLLHITSGHVPEAIDAWAPLDRLGKNNFLYLFKTGLINLANNEFDLCIQALEKGMTLNRSNEALNRDMKRMLDQVKAQTNSAAPSTEAKPKSKSTKTNNVLLSAYQKENDEKPER